VIGAGISGLTAGKAIADVGVPYTCFETSDRIGGNWAFKNPNGRSSAYRSLHIDTSKGRISFEDFPMGAEYPDFPHHTQIFEWLNRYADTFGLREKIQFGTTVEAAERLPEGGWRIRTDDGAEHAFDMLVVGNGHHWDPRLPEYPGAFDGPTLHSHHYIDPTDPLDIAGKRVLVVGIGNSAVDIVSEISRAGVAEKTFVSTRSGAWVMPKYIFGRPVDTVVKTNPRVPLWLQRRIGGLAQRIVSGNPENFGLPRPNHRFLEAHPTVSSEFLLRLGSGDAIAKPDVAELLGDRVRFADGSVEAIDVIIYATGYKITLPFFDPDFISAPDNKLRLYKRMFKPGFDDLAFIGMAQAIPTLFPFVELQSKLLARYLDGTWALPSPAAMEQAIRDDEAKFVKHYSNRPRHTMQVDYYLYKHDFTKRVLPEGEQRARTSGAVHLAGRASRARGAAS
jgi:cation diffusion facilitator CzcD-associated flavoprotein CzcO